MRQTSAGKQASILPTYSSVVANVMDHCPRFDATAAVVLQPSSSSSSNSKYRSNTKVDGKDDYQDSQSSRIEGWTPVVSGAPFGKIQRPIGKTETIKVNGRNTGCKATHPSRSRGGSIEAGPVQPPEGGKPVLRNGQHATLDSRSVPS